MANRTDLPSQISTNPDYLLGFDHGQPVAVPFSDPNGENASFPSSVSVGGSTGSARPKLLIFGNSIAAQSGIAWAGGIFNAGASFIRSGATAYTASANQTISDGTKLAIAGYYGETIEAVVNGAVAAATSIPVRAALPIGVRPGAAGMAGTYTTAKPSAIRQSYGPVSCALAQLGMPFEICNPTYGYGGSRLDEMIHDLPMMLDRVRPQYVAMHMFENDIDAVGSTGYAWSDLVVLARTAVKLVVSAGAVPIVCSSVPSSNFTTVAECAAFDAQLAWVNGIRAEFPTAIPVDMSTPWLDTADTTKRSPIAGVASDGIHPDASKRFYASQPIKIALATIAEQVGTPNRAPLNLSNFDFRGSGGSLVGAGWTGGSIAPTGWTPTAESGVAATASRNADGSLKIVGSIAGASNVTTTRLYLTQTITLQNAAGSNNALRPWCKFRINSQAGLSLTYVLAQYSGGEQYSGGQNEALLPTDTAMLGKLLTMEGAAVRVPDGATSVTLQFLIRPQTIGSPSGVAFDFDFYELGIEPAAVY